MNNPVPTWVWWVLFLLMGTLLILSALHTIILLVQLLLGKV